MRRGNGLPCGRGRKRYDRDSARKFWFKGRHVAQGEILVNNPYVFVRSREIYIPGPLVYGRPLLLTLHGTQPLRLDMWLGTINYIENFSCCCCCCCCSCSCCL